MLTIEYFTMHAYAHITMTTWSQTWGTPHRFTYSTTSLGISKVGGATYRNTTRYRASSLAREWTVRPCLRSPTKVICHQTNKDKRRDKVLNVLQLTILKIQCTNNCGVYTIGECLYTKSTSNFHTVSNHLQC